MPGTEQLDPRFRPLADGLLEYARSRDPAFMFTSTFRSHTDQQRLYAEYLRGKSPFPALPPGRSQHERGLAVDMARLGVDPQRDELLHEIGREAKAKGWVWGGMADPVHFEASWAKSSDRRKLRTSSARRPRSRHRRRSRGRRRGTRRHRR